MTASSLINEYLDKFYEYLIERGYKPTTASTYKKMVKLLISKNINPLNFEEVALKLSRRRKDKKIIGNYLTACKRYKEFLQKHMEITRPSARYKVYLTRSEALVILQVLLKIAERYNVNARCKSCGKISCNRKCLVETAIGLAKELLVHLNGQRSVQDIKSVRKVSQS